jgi:hypothetical protein
MPTPVSIPEGLRAGLNGGAADLPRAVAVKRVGGIQAAVPSAVDDPIWGVTMAPIPVGTWGDVQTRGVAIMQAGFGGMQEGQRIMPEPNTGKAIAFNAPAGANAAFIGVALTTTAADQYGEVELAGPGASRHA